MIVYTPVIGRIVAIEEVNDPVFAEKMIGDGMAVYPGDTKICSPIDGVIETIFPTNHAFIIKSDNERSLLVHIGLDTVELKGCPFQRAASVNEKVKAGDPIIIADYQAILDKGFDPIVIIVSASHKIVEKTIAHDALSVKQHLFTIE